MVKIRLARFGKKKQPTFRLVVSDSRKDTFDRYIESVGFYDPRAKNVEINSERVKYWQSQGVQFSPAVHNLLVENKIIDAKKLAVSSLKKKKDDKKSEQKETTTAEKTEKIVENEEKSSELAKNEEKPTKPEKVVEKTAEETTDSEKKDAEKS